MKNSKHILVVLGFLMSSVLVAQKDSLTVKTQQLQLAPIQYRPLSPARAAFYSAVFPGAGQIYNNRYWWQLPLIYGGLGTSLYYYVHNSNEYSRYRTAYKRRKSGLSDEFDGKGPQGLFISTEGLESAQRQLQENRDYSLLFVVLTYVLQIVEASVTAHLIQFDSSDDLSLQPTTIPDPTFENFPKVGLTLKYSF